MKTSRCKIVLTLVLGGAAIVGPARAETRYRMVACQFPDGWNPADYQRQIRGDAPDAHHQCRVDSKGKILDSHGRQTN